MLLVLAGMVMGRSCFSRILDPLVQIVTLLTTSVKSSGGERCE